MIIAQCVLCFVVFFKYICIAVKYVFVFHLTSKLHAPTTAKLLQLVDLREILPTPLLKRLRCWRSHATTSTRNRIDITSDPARMATTFDWQIYSHIAQMTSPFVRLTAVSDVSVQCKFAASRISFFEATDDFLSASIWQTSEFNP